jgi:hypothetical protein
MSIASELSRGVAPVSIVKSWSDDVAQFKNERREFLLY